MHETTTDAVGILDDTVAVEGKNFGRVGDVLLILNCRIEMGKNNEVGRLLCRRTRHGILGELCNFCNIIQFEYCLSFLQSPAAFSSR